ncbi:MAG: PEP-CTERM sorting domain-containing protein [Desulfobulbus sp.]
MKNLLHLTVLSIFLGIGGNAYATPVSIDVDDVHSSVHFSSYNEGMDIGPFSVGGESSLSVALASGLGDVAFTLADGATSPWFNFLTFTSTGTGMGNFGIEAVMAFDLPTSMSVSMEGYGAWISLTGIWSIIGGALYWEDNTVDFLDSAGNNLTLTLQQGLTIQPGSTINLQANITNYGGGIAPVPEPATMLLFGAGLIGLAGMMRNK